MSATITTYGYLELPYLTEDNGVSVATYAYPTQVNRQIGALHNINTQVNRQINGIFHAVKTQVDRVADDLPHTILNQVSLLINSTHNINAQVQRITRDAHGINTQVNRAINSGSHDKGMEVNRGKLMHETCGDAGYLIDAYLVYDYMVKTFCVPMGVQVNRQITLGHDVNTQVSRSINSLHNINTQVQRRIDSTHDIATQVNRVKAVIKGTQVLFALYNTYNLRILCDFQSRGVSGLNWTSNTTAAGYFSIYNVNTDIVEQVWRSATGIKTGIVLTCDTQISQGVFLDTLGILNHNLTRSATVTLQGSNDPGFGTIPFNENLEVIDEPNLYYIAPTLPTTSYRYWRFIINDSTNTNSSIQIGTIVFGSSIIFQGECFVDQVNRGTKHFSDKVVTEGFTNVSNDRALKYSTQLEFRFLNFNKGNYRNIRSVFRTARTSLKCLWIPTPRFPERFAVFGKLNQIPVESHKVISEEADYVSFNLEVDESL